MTNLQSESFSFWAAGETCGPWYGLDSHEWDLFAIEVEVQYYATVHGEESDNEVLPHGRQRPSDDQASAASLRTVECCTCGKPGEPVSISLKYRLKVGSVLFGGHHG